MPHRPRSHDHVITGTTTTSIATVSPGFEKRSRSPATRSGSMTKYAIDPARIATAISQMTNHTSPISV
ncbi:hypothetical protein ACQFYA_05175 [Promicromonospora sp. Marseille-Q5078]